MLVETTLEYWPVPSISLRDVVEQFALISALAGYDYGPSRHDELVRTFVTSLATKRIVILTGLSGSGKTKIAQNFGDWLGTGCLQIIAVRPDWTNPDPLLGYENGLSELKATGYAWNVPEALAFILRAVQNATEPHLLILDEMNLAHVERYFADVLSGIESNHSVVPNLVSQGGEWRIAHSDRARLPFPPNLFIVGTVNVDETTYMFSPKVLDPLRTQLSSVLQPMTSKCQLLHHRPSRRLASASIGIPQHCEPAGDPCEVGCAGRALVEGAARATGPTRA